MSAPPDSTTLKYQLDVAGMIKELLGRAYRIDGIRVGDLAFTSYGAYHEFTFHLGASHHPDVKIIVKAMPPEGTPE